MPRRSPRISRIVRTVNGAIADQSIRHAIHLEAFKGHEVKRVLSLLEKDVLPDLLDRVSSRLRRIHVRGVDATAKNYGHLGELVAAINAQVLTGVRAIRDVVQEDMQRLALTESKWQQAMIQRVFPVEVVLLSAHAGLLRKVVTERPMQGALLKDWWEGLSNSTATRVTRQIQIGIVQGESVDNMVRRLTGTAANGFTDGVLQTTRREAETIVRTATAHVTSQARLETFKANSDVIRGERWMSALDHRTCEICAGLDGQEFELGEGVREPAHPGCRCLRIPITKSFRELGIDLDDPPPPTRAAKDYTDLKTALRGEVPGDMTYGQWLRQQPRDVQEEVLGVRGAQLFRSNQVSIEQFTDSRLRPRTLEELERVAAAG